MNPELEFLVDDLCDADKKVVTDAFYAFAKGDSNGFNARFSVLLKAHSLALGTFPIKLKKLLVNAQSLGANGEVKEINGRLEKLERAVHALLKEIKRDQKLILENMQPPDEPRTFVRTLRQNALTIMACAMLLCVALGWLACWYLCRK